MKQFKRGDKVEYVSKKLNEGFLDEVKNIPTEVERVERDRSYKSGYGLKITLWHDPIDSNYFKKLENGATADTDPDAWKREQG